MNYAILVIDQDGDKRYLCDGFGDRPSRFPSRAAALKQVEFMKIGMEGEVQSINVVKYPAKKKVS